MSEKGRQDKECATDTFEPPNRAEAQAGNPLCPNGGIQTNKYRERRYIRITDVESWRLIDKISQDETYAKSFNKIITDALFYGLPVLYEKLFGEVSLSEEVAPPSQRKQAEGIDEKSFNVLVKLLKETVLNVTINKSILSSVFHDLVRINKVLDLDNELYEQGLISDTPDYLYDYEVEGLKKMRR